MERKKGINFYFAFICIILGWTLFKHADFKNLKLQDPVLDILYLAVFIVSLYLLVKDYKKNAEK